MLLTERGWQSTRQVADSGPWRVCGVDGGWRRRLHRPRRSLPSHGDENHPCGWSKEKCWRGFGMGCSLKFAPAKGSSSISCCRHPFKTLLEHARRVNAQLRLNNRVHPPMGAARMKEYAFRLRPGNSYWFLAPTKGSLGQAGQFREGENWSSNDGRLQSVRLKQTRAQVNLFIL